MDIYSMLKSAQSDYNSQQKNAANSSQNNTVASFFTQCSAATAKQQNVTLLTAESIEKNLSRISKHNNTPQNNKLKASQKSQQQSSDLANSPFAQFLNGNNGNTITAKNESGGGNSLNLIRGYNTAETPSNGPRETKLITPIMLEKSCVHKNGNNNDEKIKQQQLDPEPLTQNQLMVALKYLINNDDEFAKKVHDAYLKSMKSS